MTVVTSLPSSSIAVVLVLDRVGIATPKVPVTAIGRRYFMLSDRPPKPLPANSAGVTVLKVSAPTRFAPVLPMSQSTPNEAMLSAASFLWNWYFTLAARLSAPFTVSPPSGTMRSPVALRPTPKLGVMRLV